MYRYLHIRVTSIQFRELRHQEGRFGFLQKSFAKFTNRKNCVSHFVTISLIALKICEKPTKETHGIFFLFRGILSTVPSKNHAAIIASLEVPMEGKVEICGVDTSKLSVLSPVEMDVLRRRARQGDLDAR